MLLVVVDTLRGDRLSSYGYERATTPALDELAARGALFEDVTAQWPWTLPSMVSLMQGRYVTDYRDLLLDDAPALAEVLRAAGYRTLAVVANPLVNERQGFNRGFEYFDVTESERFEDPHEYRDVRALTRPLSAPLAHALELDEHGRRAPVFVFLHLFDPHTPNHPREAYERLLPASGARPVQPAGWQLEALAARPGARPETETNWQADIDKMRELRGLYEQELRYLDDGFAALYAELEQLGFTENLVAALVSDHGQGLWDHSPPESDEWLAAAHPSRFFYQKHGATMYQEAIATPLLLWGAGVPAGLRIAAPVENVDLYPTLLQLVGLSPPPGLHGRSLVPLLARESGTPDGTDSPAPSWRRYVFSYGTNGGVVRDTRENLKLIVPQGKALHNGRGFELYDLSSDPFERRDLAAEHPQTVAELAVVYRSWLGRYPTPSSLPAAGRPAELRQRLLEQLGELGYTEFDTGATER